MGGGSAAGVEAIEARDQAATPDVLFGVLTRCRFLVDSAQSPSTGSK